MNLSISIRAMPAEMLWMMKYVLAIVTAVHIFVSGGWIYAW